MRKVTQRKTPDWAGATPLFGGQSAQKFCPGRSRPLLHSGALVFSPRAKQPRSWPSNSQVPVKWASPPYFTATSPATSPSIEHGITEINQMNRPEERNCARPRPRLRRERPHPLTHGASSFVRSLPPHRQGVAWGAPENLSDKMSDILNDHERRSLLPILKAPPKQPKTVTVQARVEESVKTQLELYAEFIDASPSYVITEALKLLFRKDDDFRRWADQHANNHNN